MSRMKTFLIYVLLIIGFFAVSVVLENGLLVAMYSKINGELNGYYEQANSHLSFQNVSAKACNVNGYINFDLKNTTPNLINQAYLKIDLYNETGLLADTEYVLIDNMEQGDTKTYHLKFKANHIQNFKIAVVNQMPDKSNIISILGWEFDVTNVFGMDLSNTTIFGVKLTDIFSVENAKKAGSSAWNWIKLFLASVPGWAYFMGGLIVAWNLPAFYLFGIL